MPLLSAVPPFYFSRICLRSFLSSNRYPRTIFNRLQCWHREDDERRYHEKHRDVGRRAYHRLYVRSPWCREEPKKDAADHRSSESEVSEFVDTRRGRWGGLYNKLERSQDRRQRR